MAYATLSTSKWNCLRGENEALPIFERKDPKEALFIVNGIKTFTYKDIKLRGVNACISDVKRVIKERKLGQIYTQSFNDIDESYFTDSDFGMLAAYFDQFMKDIYTILNPNNMKVQNIVTRAEKKTQLEQKKVDLNKQIKEMQEELKNTETEAAGIDVEAINSEIDGGESYTNSSRMPL